MGDGRAPLGHAVAKPCDQIPDRHGGDDDIALQYSRFTVLFIGYAANLPAVRLQGNHAAVFADFAAHFFNAPRHGFPKLPGTEFGINKFLDQRGFHFLPLLFPFGKYFLEHILDYCCNG